MKIPLFVIITIGVFGMLVFSCTKENTPEELQVPFTPCDGMHLEFWFDIRQIFKNNCTLSGCHDAGSVNSDFTSYKLIKSFIDDIPGTFENRALVIKDMPPSPLFLSPEDINKLNCWVQAGYPN